MSISNIPDSLSWLDQTKAYLAQTQYIEALTSIHQGLTVESRNAEAWLQCGTILQKLGFYGEAITANHNAQRLYDSPDADLELIPFEVLLAQAQGQMETVGSPSSITQAGLSPVVSADFDFWWKRARVSLQAGDYAAALSAYDRALEFRPQEAQAWYRRGLALYHLRQYEAAIASFDQAIDHQPNCYQAWNNRASILVQFGKLEEAIHSYDKALQGTDGQLWQAWDDRSMAILHLRGLEAGVTALDEGIQALWRDSEDYQLGCGSLHQHKGDLHSQYAWQHSHPLSQWRAAKLSYLKALSLLDFKTFPQQHLEVWQSLLQVRFHLQEKTAIHSMLLEAAIKLKTLHQDPDLTSEQHLQIEHKFAGFQQMQVNWLIVQNQLQKAVLWAEQCLDRHLGCWRFGLEYEANQLQYDDLQPLLNPQRAIIIWHDSPVALSTFILKHDQDPILFWAGPNPPEQTNTSEREAFSTHQHAQLQRWQKTWQKSQQSSRDTDQSLADRVSEFWLQGQAAQQLAQLKEIIGIETLCQTELSNIHELILITPAAWRSVPLPLMFSEQFSITTLPSLQISLNLLQSESVHKNHLLSIVPPVISDAHSHNGSSELSELEALAISQAYSQQIQLSGPQLTKKTAMAALKVSGGRVHFTGVIEQNPQQPAHTAMLLTPPSRLLLSELMALNWDMYSMVCLTGGTKVLKSAASPILDIDLETVLLTAGVQHVISSLWPVNHYSRVLLMAHFHQLLTRDSNPVHALKQAQHWLRSRTYPEILEWLTHLAETPDIPPKCVAMLNSIYSQVQSTADQDDAPRYPYLHPWYWAGFTIMGNFPELVVW